MMTEDTIRAEIAAANEAKWNTNPQACPIEYWRERANMTQDDLAAKCELSSPTISRAERGLPISRKTLNIIARALEIDPGFIQINLTKKDS